MFLGAEPPIAAVAALDFGTGGQELHPLRRGPVDQFNIYCFEEVFVHGADVDTLNRPLACNRGYKMRRGSGRAGWDRVTMPGIEDHGGAFTGVHERPTAHFPGKTGRGLAPEGDGATGANLAEWV
ncbi:hypothetical protein AWY79_00230 [Pseudodesulfovibrio indicus]|uniref:Uncharacterized protein n=1 Tax=Pseudodesulfovibrio indicus TaxID=1716143 RepID=A0ABM5YQH4_9BACT|nr:hypothetical protein AWY79_00230 [Pseudodesulfovibrio indicus]